MLKTLMSMYNLMEYSDSFSKTPGHFTAGKVPKYGVTSGPCSLQIQENTDQE